MDATAGTFDRVGPLRLTGMLAMAGGLCYFASALVLERASSADHAGASLLGTFWTIGSIARLE